MEAQPKRKKRWGLRALLLTFLLILLLTGIFFGYVSVYYHADEAALAALRSDGAVTVTQTGTGWFFDGPSESDALIFYPGGKVEETAYAPLLRQIADGQMDVFLLKVPFRLAVLSPGKAADVMVSRSYGPGRYDADYEERGQDYPIGYVRWTEGRNMESFVDLIADGKIDVLVVVVNVPDDFRVGNKIDLTVIECCDSGKYN